MNQRYQSHLFWGSHAPLSSLVNTGLIIMGSGRTAYAIVTLLALLWVYELTFFVSLAAKPVFPRRGRNITLLFLSSLFGSLFFLLLFLMSPILAMDTGFLILLTPVTALSSGLYRRLEALDTEDSMAQVFSEAMILGLLILALALIREPLGFGSLSLPGGFQGIITLFRFEGEFFPLRIIAASSGALILLGYGAALFRRKRNQYTHGEDL
ncbi:MAG: hypothetical protein LBP32_04845 [Spirochaetaceae bacterium]|jgi:hypothetical protein|nr:hypothetical protein [Spirochaetaceae bacterium]